MSRRYNETTSEHEAKQVMCPKCGAKKDEGCVYVPLGQHGLRRAQFHSSMSRDRLDRVGTQTKRVHNERREAAWQKKLRTLRQCGPQPVPGQSPVLVAVRVFDVAEYQRMREWLLQNHQLFAL